MSPVCCPPLCDLHPSPPQSLNARRYLLGYPKSSDSLPPSVLPADSQHHTASDTSVLPSLSPSSLSLFCLSCLSSGALMLNNSAAQSREGRREENVNTERDVNAKADGWTNGREERRALFKHPLVSGLTTRWQFTIFSAYFRSKKGNFADLWGHNASRSLYWAPMVKRNRKIDPVLSGVM